MKELKVLFAMNQSSSHNIEKAILNKYEEKNNKTFAYDKAFYNLHILKCLDEQEYDIVIVSEMLESTPIEIPFIDTLTDKHSNVRVILIMEDHRRGSNFVKSIYAMGCYDCIFKSDFNYVTILNLMNEPRNKKAAKDYYEIDDSNLGNIEESINVTKMAEIEEQELQVVLNNLNNATDENIKELYTLAQKTYSFPQMTFLISLLNAAEDKKVINLIKANGCDIAKYEIVLATEVAKSKVKDKVKEVEKIVEKIVEKEVVKREIVEKEVIKKEYIDREVVKEVYKTPTDYKKVVAIIGADRRVGATTLVEMLSETFTNENKKVGILDLTSNQELFEKYIFNEDIKFNPLQELLNGISKPFMINKKCSLYTSTPQNGLNLDTNEMARTIDMVKRENDIVLIDLNLKDIEKIYTLLDKILVVITQDLTSAKYFSDTLYSLMENIFLSNIGSKMQFVINKHIKDSKVLSNKHLVECYLHKIVEYLDTSLNKKILDNQLPILEVGFNQGILLNSYRGEHLNLVEEVQEDIYQICNSIYPLSQKTVKGIGFIGSLFKRIK